MLDTVKVMLSGYQVKPDNNLTVQPASYIEGSGKVLSEYPLWKKASGAQVLGSKAFYNSEKCNLTIAPIGGGGVVAFCHFSVPKILYGDNYYQPGRESTQAVLGVVERELSGAGVETDLQEASLSRIDTFQVGVMEEPYTAYAPIFSLLSGNRQQRRDYGTSYLWGNSQAEQMIYDKCKEGEIRGVARGTYPDNSLRAELRLLNKRKIENTIGFSRVQELSSSERWEMLKQKNREAWGKLFRYEPGEFEILATTQMSSELRYYRERYGRNYLNFYVQAVGSYYLATVAGIDTVKSALRVLGEDRLKIYRMEKRLEQAQAELSLLREEPTSHKTLGVLYQELREKLYLN